MAKKVLTLIKLQVPAGQANPAPPVGPALGQHGVNIMEFCKAFNAKTQQDSGTIIPVEITVYEDRSFDFITKTPPAAVLIKEAAGLEKGSGEPHTNKVGSITVDQARQIAERKMPGLNVRHAEEQLRGTLALPRGLGKDVTIAVFAEGDQKRQAEEAGAQFVGGEDLASKVEEGWTDFDVAIATPAMMPAVGKLGRVLGPQGKMPNPKVGTVTDDVSKAVGEAKAGKVEYRTDKQAIVHLAIGKTSFDESALLENYAAVIEEIIRAKPAAAKGRYVLTITITPTMGPGIRVDTTKVRASEIMAGAGRSPADEPAEGGEAEASESAEPQPA